MSQEILEIIRSVECPRCHAKPGERCIMPSGRKILYIHSHSWRWNLAIMKRQDEAQQEDRK